MRRAHAANYQVHYGVPAPAKTACRQPGCTAAFWGASELPDHELKRHGLEVPEKLTTLKVLRRMYLPVATSKYLDEAKALNAKKVEIARKEAELTHKSDYTSKHGLDVTTMWSEEGNVAGTAAAQPRVAALRSNRPASNVTPQSEYVAEQLRDVRLEACQTGLLRDGTTGTWVQILVELHNL